MARRAGTTVKTRCVVAVLALVVAAQAGARPFEGTAFMSPNVITAAEPGSAPGPGRGARRAAALTPSPRPASPWWCSRRTSGSGASTTSRRRSWPPRSSRCSPRWSATRSPSAPGRASPGPGPRAGSSAARSARLASRASMARRTRAGASSNATSAPARWRGFDERVDINCSGVMAPRRRVSPSSALHERSDEPTRRHAPAPWPGRVTVRRQRRLAARPVRPQDARRRGSRAVSGPPPRSCAGSGTR